MKKLMLILGLMIIAGRVHAITSLPQGVLETPAVSISSAPALSNATATVTITTAPNSGPYSTGLLTYLNHVHIEALSVGQIAGSTTLVTCTTTNIGGTPSFNFTVAPATGTITITDMDYSSPIPSSASGNIVISCPANANIRWNLMATYTYQPQ